MPDGTRLSARIWRPKTTERVAVLLEYLPYRLEDFTAWRDSTQHAYFAGFGYASIRVDIRGTGSSEGVCLGEYLQQEQDDAVAIIAWLAEQPWCNGKVGMFGISWGGFNALQVAALRPPALKAIIAVAATDDRYTDDVHFLGGCVLGSEMLAWASTMLAYNARPPRYHCPGTEGASDVIDTKAEWKDRWLERLKATPPYVEDWLNHQTRDEFWQHGSVNVDYANIECPVFIVGGWADGYINSVFRLSENLSGPVRALLGPWAHAYPEFATPGPAIGFLQEALDWWDRWLCDIDNGIDQGDQFRAWIQDWVQPASNYDERPGHWVSEPSWPPPSGRLSGRQLWLSSRSQPPHSGSGSLVDKPVRDGDSMPLAHTGAQRHGLHSGGWWSLGEGGDQPLDQRLDDGLALSFDAEAASEVTELLGRPVARLRLSLDQAVGLVSVRLCDVAPDGSSLLLSRGVLNFTHRDGHENPEPVIPGEWMHVEVAMDGLGHSLPAGHRLRLAISNTLWPLAWPAPKSSQLSIDPTDSSVIIPIRLTSELEEVRPDFRVPEMADGGRKTTKEATRIRSIHHDLDRDRVTLLDESFDGEHEVAAYGVVFSSSSIDRYEITEGDPLSARAHCERTVELSWAGVDARVETVSTMRADETHWHVTNHVRARADGETIFDEESSFSTRRQLC